MTIFFIEYVTKKLGYMLCLEASLHWKKGNLKQECKALELHYFRQELGIYDLEVFRDMMIIIDKTCMSWCRNVK